MMSSGDEESASKKRKVPRACDGCRRKKVRCDSATVTTERCSNCVIAEIPCTFLESAKRRGPTKSYVQGLENRVQALEDLLQSIQPGLDTTIPPTTHITTQGANGLTFIREQSTSYKLLNQTVDGDVHAESSDDGNVMTEDEDQDSPYKRYVGKASQISLIQQAMLAEEQLRKPGKGLEQESVKPRKSSIPTTWTSSPSQTRPNYAWPDQELMDLLIDSYFTQLNCVIPLLHRPTFTAQIAQGLHMQDVEFGGTVLLVCAIGTRMTEDPRVFIHGTKERNGSKWADQVRVIERSTFTSTSLHLLQIYCLSVLFLHASSTAQAAWNLVGFGLRIAQDMGLHRKKRYHSPLTVEDELLKRAFWVLVTIDRHTSAGLGRPIAIQMEDIDTDFPIECDDEYWTQSDPTKAFQQPPDHTSNITGFNCGIKLSSIMAIALRTIYAINKSKVLLGFSGPKFDSQIVKELDGALKRWTDELPDHLRWDPNCENMVFFSQSASLHVYYHSLQILVHRPFILSPHKPSAQSLSSLAICTNAARSCSQLLDAHLKRATLFHPAMMAPAFTAGVVILLNIWGNKRSGRTADVERNLADYQHCMDALKHGANRWLPAGRLWQLLERLASFGDVSIHESSATALKRTRGLDRTTVVTVNPPIREASADRPIAGSRRARSALPRTHSSGVPSSQAPQSSDSEKAKEIQLRPVQTQSLGRYVPHVSPLHVSEYTNHDLATTSPPVPSVSSTPTSATSAPFHHSLPAQIKHSSPVHNDYIDYSSSSTHSFGANAISPSTHAYQQTNDMYGGNFIPVGSSPGLPFVPSQSYEQHSAPTTYGNDMSMLPQDLIMDIDHDTLALWKSAPSGFEFADWGAYMLAPPVLNSPTSYAENMQQQAVASPGPSTADLWHPRLTGERQPHPFYGR